MASPHQPERAPEAPNSSGELAAQDREVAGVGVGAVDAGDRAAEQPMRCLDAVPAERPALSGQAAAIGQGVGVAASADYAAARAGDRDRAKALLAEAEPTTNRLADQPDRHRALVANLVSHKVSAAYLLGDAGTALAHAHSLPIAAIPTTERRARLLVDTAQAWAQWDKPDQAYRTLLAAERTAPGEVRTRNAVRRLVGDLLTSPKQASMPGLPALVSRVHAA